MQSDAREQPRAVEQMFPHRKKVVYLDDGLEELCDAAIFNSRRLFLFLSAYQIFISLLYYHRVANKALLTWLPATRDRS